MVDCTVPTVMRLNEACCLLATLALASAQRPDGRPDGGQRGNATDRGPQPNPVGRPDGDKAPYPDDDNRGCPFDDIPDDIKLLMRELIAGTKTAVDLLPHIGDIPAPCFRRISAMFKQGTCTVAQVKETVCEIGGQVEKTKALLHCLNRDNICELVINLLASQGDDCVKSEFVGFYSDLISKLHCPTADLPPVTFLFLNNNILRRKLHDMNLVEFLAFLKTFRDQADLLMLTRCDKLQLIAEAVVQKLGQTTLGSLIQGQMLTQDDILPFLPYFPPRLCASLSQSLLLRIGIETLAELPFKCGPKKDRMEDLEDSLDDRMRGMMGVSEPGDSDEMDSDEMEDRIRHMRQVLDGPHCEFSCGYIIARTLTHGDNPIDLGSPTLLESLGYLGPCLSKRAVIDTAQPGQCGSIGTDLVPAHGRDRKRLADRCRPDGRGTGNMTVDDVQAMGCAVLGLSKKELDEIPVGALRGALSMIKACLEEAESDFLKKLVHRLRSGNLTRDEVKGLGRAVAHSSRERLRELSDSDLKDREVLRAIVDGIKGMADNRDPGAKARAFDIANKLDDYKDIADSEDMMSSISRKKLEAKLKEMGGGRLEPNATRRLLGLDRPSSDPKPSFSQRRLLVRALLEGKLPEDLTEEDLEALKGRLMNGLSAEFIEKLAENREKLRLLSRMCMKGGWDGQQVKALYELIKKAFEDYNWGDPFSEFTTAHAQAFSSECLLGVRDDDIRNMSDSACAEVCAKKGRAAKLMCFVDRATLEKVIQACLECRGKADTDDSLTEEDVDALGKALQAAPEEVLDRIPTDVLIKKARLFRMRCTLRNIRDKIRTKLQDHFNGNVNDEEKAEIIERAGAYILSKLPASVRERVKEILAVRLDSILEDIGTPEDEEDAEEVECCRDMNTDEENKEIDDEEDELEEQIAEVVDSTSNPAKRKRRAADSYTCADLKSMGSAITKLSAMEIDQIPQEEFYNCLSAFGAGMGWSTEQGNALLAKLKSLVSSNICDLTSSHLQGMQNIGYHLSEQDIKCLNNLDEDAVTDLGALHAWSPEQAAAFAQKYMSRINIVSPGGLAASHLVSLGHFLCGLTVDQIKQIQPAQYMTAAATLGTLLKTCPYNKLEALTHVAKQPSAYGRVSDWDASVYREIGIILAGLSGSELKAATAQDIEGWHINGIKLIPLDHLKMLEAAHYDAFNRQQGLAIPEERKNMLSVSQMNAINRAVYGEDAPIILNGQDPVTETPQCTGTTCSSTAMKAGFGIILSVVSILLLI